MSFKKEKILTAAINLIRHSETKYKAGDFKGAIEDRREAKRLFITIKGQGDYKDLISKSIINKSKYNLIEDYKKRIDSLKQIELIRKLENISEQKYKLGDYKGAIVAFRRAEKYY